MAIPPTTPTNLDFLVREGQIRAEAVVRHAKPRSGLGVKFTAITEDDRPKLAALLARLRGLSRSSRKVQQENLPACSLVISSSVAKPTIRPEIALPALTPADPAPTMPSIRETAKFSSEPELPHRFTHKIRRSTMKTRTLTLFTAMTLFAALGIAVQTSAQKTPEQIITFDAGPYGTIPTSINRAGVITGYHYDKSGIPHGFLRCWLPITRIGPPTSRIM